VFVAGSSEERAYCDASDDTSLCVNLSLGYSGAKVGAQSTTCGCFHVCAAAAKSCMVVNACESELLCAMKCAPLI
jgi:hypothetical protein